MFRTFLFALTLTISCMASAEMTAEQRCAKQGEVAGRAAELRASGTDKESANQTLLAEYPVSESGVTEQDILGLSTLAYMAKMSPDGMRDYAIDQCMQNILR